MEFKLELVLLPVSDVDRAKTFYAENAGFNLDVDHRAGDDFRVVQLTPPGSACSIAIGTGMTEMRPGCLVGLQMVVADIQQAHQQLTSRGVAVTPIQVQPWGSFVYFSDPDGNRWSIQELPPR
jgi:predicted enzyme related to lactoylglutathione lyase